MISEFSDTAFDLLALPSADGYIVPGSDLDLELRLHHGPSGQPDSQNPLGLDGWSENHASRYPDFSAVEYDPNNTDHQINVGKTACSKLLFVIPHKILSSVMQKKYEQAFGQRGRIAAEAFNTTSSGKEFEGRELTVGAAIGELVLRGKSVAILTPHATGLEDVGVVHGNVAMSLGQKRSRLIRRGGVILNKALAREKYKGKSMAEWFKFFGNIYWTIPDTDGPSQWKLEDDVTYRVIRRGAEAISADIKDGVAITIAGAGTAMKERRKPDGSIYYFLPEFSPATVGLINGFDHFVVASSTESGALVSQVNDIEVARGKDRNKIRACNANAAQEILAQFSADLLGAPVEYVLVAENKNDEGISKTVYPLAA